MLRKNEMAKTPPMGWNSWDCYAATVNEEQLLGNARYMAQHLKACGWEYVVCDIQWSDPMAGSVPGMEYRHFAKLCMDAYGRLMPAEERFPSARDGQGFAPIARQIHELGLKFGIHIMRGIPRQAVHAGLPILGTDKTADQIANPFSICKWNGDMYGVLDIPASQAYYDSLFQLYAEWGVDFVKVDDICNTNLYVQNPYSAEAEIEMIRRAIDRCGRDMVLSLSPGPAVIEKAWHLEQNANMWRMTDDFWDDWRLLKQMFERCEVWQAHVGPGNWPDCDMLPLGHIGMGFGRGRNTRFTPEEQKTMMTLWSIFRSPLFLGGELRDNDEATLRLITNPEVLRLNHASQGARQLYRDAEKAAWISQGEDGGLYLALFNLSDAPMEQVFPLSMAGVSGASVRDLWAQKDLGTHPVEIRCVIAAHDALLYHLTTAK